MAVKKKKAAKKKRVNKSASETVENLQPDPEPVDDKNIVIITKKDVATMLGVNERSLSSYQSQEDDPLPIHRVGGRGKSNDYSLKDVHQWGIRRYLRQLGITDETNKPIDFFAERARLTKEQADGQALKNEIARKEQAPVKLLELALADLAEQIGSTLDSIPIKIKRRLPKLGSADMDIMRREIAKCRNAASKVKLDWSKLEAID